MKNERQEKILAIIAASAIETQEQLIDSPVSYTHLTLPTILLV